MLHIRMTTLAFILLFPLNGSICTYVLDLELDIRLSDIFPSKYETRRAIRVKEQYCYTVTFASHGCGVSG